MKSNPNPENRDSGPKDKTGLAGGDNLPPGAYVGQALRLLRAGLAPAIRLHITRAVESGRLKKNWADEFVGDETVRTKPVEEWDVPLMLGVIRFKWKDVFRKPFSNKAYNLVLEVIGHRNDWAHQRPFSAEDAFRAIDTIARLLKKVYASQYEDVDQLRSELLQVMWEGQQPGDGTDSVPPTPPGEDEKSDRGSELFKKLSSALSRVRPIDALLVMLGIAAVLLFFIWPKPDVCHPSYNPICLSLDQDVDCSEISVEDRPFNVIGPDEYGLDRDEDGIACESNR